MRSTRFTFLITVCVLLLSAKTLLAQAELDCITLVEQALTSFGTNCADLDSGMTCYGHQNVQAETNSTNTSPFSAPADQIPLSSVASLATTGANPATGEWGLALANMIPADTTESVDIILMGEAEMSLAPTVPTSLQLKGGFGGSGCAEAPSVAAIATQPNTVASLKINGVDMNALGLVVFQQESANAIKALVYNGSLTVVGGATAQGGQTLAGVMDNNGTILFWSAARPSTEAETRTLIVAADALSRLGLIEATPVPPPTATPLPTSTPLPSASCGSGVTHVVQPGENLFRIALRYGTSIDAISQANGITDINQIVVGQALVIPCGVDNGSSSVAPGSENTGSEPTSEPSGEATAVPPPATVGPGMTIDCTGFNGQLPPGAPPTFQDLFNQFCQ
ncbi:MAG: LysM peptidoglycan-binding domain-containing protein [Chloroflexi bacterium]|nr:LysM peptidoglycan-binding domain-containing protein [Chloroflexota bacterium]MCC6895582.1 LysM peptidoglycan-binding domain-containing protein [Anaerolineae bacterium]